MNLFHKAGNLTGGRACSTSIVQDNLGTLEAFLCIFPGLAVNALKPLLGFVIVVGGFVPKLCQFAHLATLPSFRTAGLVFLVKPIAAAILGCGLQREEDRTMAPQGEYLVYVF